MNVKKDLLKKSGANRVDVKPIENTISRKDFLNDTPPTYRGFRVTEENHAKLTALVKMKKHSSVNDLVSALLEIYMIAELTSEERDGLNLMIKYMK